ncbi:hypothetical protein RB614_25065 [Phytohabitans sp. ZYX-F-186]|uniref:Uncharacterized protein n=1 Tax=Phytohabitans maris TaxID=3071409 RepID=A0ABU0ZL66_9ACTN|nr:hypothetical protein [Phytohabitans sp. ZYX-F-186]MDQ7907797.1 hypothetical protein [Phytohabitans sp. ZYX-F-186]
MAKEKFELVFLAGGLLLDVLANRLRRDPATPREVVGAAMFALDQAFEERRGHLADPRGVADQIDVIKAELCSDAPHKLVLEAYLDELASRAASDVELSEAVARLREAVRGWQG